MKITIYSTTEIDLGDLDLQELLEECGGGAPPDGDPVEFTPLQLAKLFIASPDVFEDVRNELAEKCWDVPNEHKVVLSSSGKSATLSMTPKRDWVIE